MVSRVAQWKRAGPITQRFEDRNLALLEASIVSRVAHWKRAGPITQRSEDRNLALLELNILENSSESAICSFMWFSSDYWGISSNGRHWWFSGRILACHAGGPIFLPKASMVSRVAQWKRAGPITQRSEDRNLALLELNILENSSESAICSFMWFSSDYWGISSNGRHWWFSGRILACHAGGPIFLPKASMVSRVAQWKRAGPITQRSEDRNLALLEQSGAVEACWAHNPEVRGSKPCSARGRHWWFSGRILACHAGGPIFLPKASMVSRVAQWKRAGPITQRSEDRNLALLELNILENSSESAICSFMCFSSDYWGISSNGRHWWFSGRILACHAGGPIFLPKASMVSRVAQWKRAGPITQRSEDRNLALLELNILENSSESAICRFMWFSSDYWGISSNGRAPA
ncbi:predicted protein [Nematostella vectensis]|uniref:Uncharacterized protein n=1 Tax=Nematostella vectensis TaxID=45351 RepID=A7SW34_NEMVE|nr:predicted protein [Nematostella vectensis]|eukprot:XP_001624190.1 predicted protein [Nematostella vectensis]